MKTFSTQLPSFSYLTPPKIQHEPFKLEINLDDESEVETFISRHGTINGKLLAYELGLHGKGSVKAATALSNYAWNKWTALGLRKEGKIASALEYEKICDSIYKEDIEPFIECW